MILDCFPVFRIFCFLLNSIKLIRGCQICIQNHVYARMTRNSKLNLQRYQTNKINGLSIVLLRVHRPSIVLYIQLIFMVCRILFSKGYLLNSISSQVTKKVNLTKENNFNIHIQYSQICLIYFNGKQRP